MINEGQGTAQDNTNAAQQGTDADSQAAQTGTQGAGTAANDATTSTNADTANVQNASLGGEQSENANSEQPGLGQAPESEEAIFEKEYTGKPEAYDYKEVELPEGMEFNKDLTDELNQFAGKFNMSQKGANELMGLGVKVAENIKTGLLENITKQVTDQSTRFFEALKSDPEIGGNKLDETVRVADIAYKQFVQNVDDEAHKIIMSTGLVNNRSFVNAFYRMGKQMQDGSIQGGSPQGGQRTANDWYPDMAKGKS